MGRKESNQRKTKKACKQLNDQLQNILPVRASVFIKMHRFVVA